MQTTIGGRQEPEWLRNSRRRVFIDMHLPAWPDMGIAQAFDAGRLAATIADSGADSAVIFAKCQYGNFYTRLDGERLHPGLGDKDLLVELSDALHRRGLHTLAYYSVSWDERVAEQHPEWLAVRADGSRAPGRWRTLCINGPYADIVERHLREIARKPVDGIWLDMTIIGDGNCYCPRCRARWEAHGRAPMPAAAGDEGYPLLAAFRFGIIEETYARLRAAVREAAPQAVFTNNYWGYPWSSIGMGSRALGSTAHADFVTGEAYSDWTGIRSTALMPVFLRCVAGGRPYESLIGTGVNTWDFTRKPRAYLAFEAYSLFAHGATVTVDDEPFHDGRLDESLYDGDLRDIFAELARASATVEGRHVAFASIYHSQATKDAAREPDGFVRDVSGAFRMLHDLHLPADFVFDESTSPLDPRRRPVILLPCVETLRADEWGRLRAFMESGGLVVASGSMGSDPVVTADLARLGISGGGHSRFTLSYMRRPDGNGRDILVRGRHALYRSRSGVGCVVEPICETTGERFFHNNLPSPFAPTDTPALIEATVGRGALALFPQPIFRSYAKQPSPELRAILGDLFARRATPPRVRLTIPLKMDFSIVEGNGCLYVHLLNPNVEPSLCCGLMEIYDGRFERSYEYMEEEAPVYDVRILVSGATVRAVSAVREGSGVEVVEVPGGAEIRVECVRLWEVVKIEVGES